MQGLSQKRQFEVTFRTEDRSEAPKADPRGAEPCSATCYPERPAETDKLMEEVCERSNLLKAYHRVVSNEGSPGVDGMTVHELADDLKAHWSPALRTTLERRLQTAAGESSRDS
jgi:RNA-directed DNA polymerase